MTQFYDLTQTGPELQAAIDQVAVNTQGIVTEAGHRVDGDDDLQQQINEIISGDTVVKLTASPTAVFVGVQTDIALTATTTTEASSITISGGNIETATGSGTRLAATDTITAGEPGTTKYAASFVVAGITKNTSVNVAAVYPIFYGAAADAASVTYAQLTTPRTTPVGATFQLTTTDGQYIFFKVPETMTQPTHLYLVGSFDTPMGFTQVGQEDGYIIYKNNEARGAGTYTYKLE